MIYLLGGISTIYDKGKYLDFSFVGSMDCLKRGFETWNDNWRQYRRREGWVSGGGGGTVLISG